MGSSPSNMSFFEMATGFNLAPLRYSVSIVSNKITALETIKTFKIRERNSNMLERQYLVIILHASYRARIRQKLIFLRMKKKNHQFSIC